jgi:hypothetical protein
VRGYTHLKKLSRELRVNIDSLLVLAAKNDPFFSGSPAQTRQAEWFVLVWERAGYTGQRGVHLRRIHYRLVSMDPPPPMLDGMPYQNSAACWYGLMNASRFARYLGFVPADAFIDARNPDPIILAPAPRTHVQPWCEPDDPEWELPSIGVPTFSPWEIPPLAVYGYAYSLADQPVHLELWIEKSTMNGELLPLCRELGANLITGAGFQSITSAIGLLQRTKEILDVAQDRPVRVLYLSDYDPAGVSMPRGVARQLEYWRDQYAPGADIALNPVVLTREQVERYRLPRIPIKDGDLRKANFEERYGEGAVELDALEALHPGELARIVREAAEPYRDHTLKDRLDEAADDADVAVSYAWEEAIRPHQQELNALNAEAERIVERYADRVRELSQAMEAELAPISERLDSIQHAVQDAAKDVSALLPPRPEPEIDVSGEDGWLFRSARSYMDQLAAYRRHGREE